jgi:hypothetical protein
MVSHPRGRRVVAVNRTFRSAIRVKSKKRPERKICEATLLSKGAFQRIDPSFFVRDFSSGSSRTSPLSPEFWAEIELLEESTLAIGESPSSRRQTTKAEHCCSAFVRVMLFRNGIAPCRNLPSELLRRRPDQSRRSRSRRRRSLRRRRLPWLLRLVRP